VTAATQDIHRRSAVNILQAVVTGARIPFASGEPDGDVSRAIVHVDGAPGVSIKLAAGELFDHDISGQKVLRQSQAVHHGLSLAPVGMAAREAGQAIQETPGYRGRIIRDLIAPWRAFARRFAGPWWREASCWGCCDL
jgi:Zn-dependent membrane protease YugP